MKKIFSLTICFVFLAFSNLKNNLLGSNAIVLNDNYLHMHQESISKDVLNNSQTYNLEEEFLSSSLARVIQNNSQCCEYHNDCGPGIENGYSDNYLSSCRNWEGWSYGNYGSTSIPYWINMESMNTIVNIENRNLLIEDIRQQAALWNQAYMYDGSGTLVNLYEVGMNELTRPQNISGRQVVEIKRENGAYAGQFDPNQLVIRINYVENNYNNRGGRNIDTPMHEMGHLLGLYDLDVGYEGGTHKTLMGYSRNTTENTINDAITYHDIQGVAVLNNIHINHTFYKYFIEDNLYKHVCYYCDTIDANTESKEGSSHLEDSEECQHEYMQMVSLGNKQWIKCVNCYNVQVTDHTHNFTYSYEEYSNDKHKAICECGVYTLFDHKLINGECSFCGCIHQHSYDYIFRSYNSTYHKAICKCNSYILQYHIYGSSTNGVCVKCLWSSNL